jgi:hypothetical protein
MPIDFFKNPEILLANTTNFLVQGEEFAEAGILLLCEIGVTVWNDDDDGPIELLITLISNRAVYNIIEDKHNTSTQRIITAFNAVLPMSYCVRRLSGQVQMTEEIDSNWRIRMLEMIEGKRPLNQGRPYGDKPRFTWNDLYFRSPVEVSIAKELDEYKVLFLPNCMARLGINGVRENREADFLVCYEGKWGILEINGDTYHKNAAKDFERIRLFTRHGIRVFEPYEASKCIKDPKSVVVDFLKSLKQKG